MVASAIKQQIKDIDEGLAEFSESEKKEFGSKLIAKKEELQKQLKELEDAEKAAAKPAPTPEKKQEAKKEVVKEVKQSKELVKKTSKILDKLKEKVKQTKPKVEPKKPVSIVKTAKAKAVATKKVVEPKAKKTSSAAIDRARKIAMKYRKKQGIVSSKSNLERDAQRSALKAGKRITDGSHYPYIKGNVYYENRENRTDRNPKKYPRLEEGGDVSSERNYKVNLKYWVADVYEDNYEEGEGSHVNSFDGKVHKTFEFVDDLIRYISTNILYKDVSKEDFDIQDGVMSTSMLVDEANVAATDSEIELWKEDEMKLYSANYSFYVQLVEEKEATENDLRKMLGFQIANEYNSDFKEGSQVKTTVFMSTEDIGGDENIEIGTVGVVLAEPMDDEQLVQVQLAGAIHYLPQYVLEVVSGGMMAKGGEMMGKGGVTREDNSLLHFEPYFQKERPIAYIDENEKIVRPTHGYFYPHPFSKKSIKWAKNNGYKFIQDGKEMADGGMMAKGGKVESEILDSDNEHFLEVKNNKEYFDNGNIAYVETIAYLKPQYFGDYKNTRIDEKGQEFIRIGKNAKYYDNGQLAWELNYDEKGNVKKDDTKNYRKDGTIIEYAKGGKLSNNEFVEKTIVYDNGGKTFDRYTVFTPDGSVYGMSENASGFNQYLGEKNEIPKGSHLGKKLNNVPKEIEWAVIDRMETYAKGGSLMPEWAVTVTSKDGETFDWNGFAKNEDEALMMAESEAGFESVETGINMVTDQQGNKVQYAKGGSISKRGKTVTLKSGAKGNRNLLHNRYDDFEDFESYCEMYGLHKTLGYKTPKQAWDANPIVESGTNPSDFRKVSKYAKGGSLDADRYAKPMGWRWKDSAVEDGIINRASLSHSPSEKMRKQYPDYVYYENRPDKSDKHPSRRYQSLEHGGTLGKDGLEYALHSIVTDDTIGTLTNMHNKKEIESVKHTAIEILERDGDREYTMANLKDVLLQAKDGHFKSGGMFSSSRPKSAIARDRKYTSQQEWEQDYVRKASPRLTYREGKYEGGGEMHRSNN